MVDDGLRKRNFVNKEQHGSSTTSLLSSSSFSSQKTNPKPVTFSDNVDRLLVVCSVLLHIAAVLFLAWGVWLRQDLHTGDECDMTYSYRQFLPISVDAAAATTAFRFWKFVDQRDPRHSHLLHRTGSPLNRSEWCLADSASVQYAVLYIPGHWGSYQQSRSLGAHGIQLTRARENPFRQKQIQDALKTHKWNGMAQSQVDFVYTVYSVDFGEQGGALHGNLLLEQASFVAHVLHHQLVSACNLKSVAIVAHSVGGVVAQLVPALHPQTRPYLNTIVTLGTPQRPIFAWDASIQKVYNLLDQYFNQETRTVRVFISGGIRDEMIPPLVSLPSTQNHASTTLSLLAPRIMKATRVHNATLALGMDHRAIVWCHNLLSVVRTILFALAQGRNLAPKERLAMLRDHLGDTTSSNTNLLWNEHQAIFRASYPYVRVAAMEAAMLYHAELLLGLYAIVGVLYLAALDVSSSSLTFAVPLFASVLAWVWSDAGLYKLSLFGLGWVASALFLLLARLLQLVTTSSRRNTESRRHRVVGRWILAVLALILVAGPTIWLQVKLDDDDTPAAKLSVWARLYMACLVLILPLSLSWLGRSEGAAPRRTKFVAFVLPLLAFLNAGQVVLILWQGRPSEEASSLWITVVLPLWVLLGRDFARTTERTGTEVSKHTKVYIHIGRRMALCSLSFCSSPYILQLGSGFRLGYLLAAVISVELVTVLAVGS